MGGQGGNVSTGGAAGMGGAAAGSSGAAGQGGAAGLGGQGGTSGQGGAAGAAGAGGSAGGCSSADCLCFDTCTGGSCTPRVLETAVGTTIGKSRQRIALHGETALWTREGDAARVLRQSPGSSSEELAVSMFPQAILTSGERLFWSDENGLVSCTLPACSALPLVNDADANERQLLVFEGNHVYWLGEGVKAGSIFRCELSECLTTTPQTVATSQGLIVGMAASDTHLYWTRQSTGDVMRVALGSTADGSTPALVSGQSMPSGLAVQTTPGGDQLFWTQEDFAGDVWQCLVENDICSPSKVAPAVPQSTPIRTPTSIAVRGGFVYWTNQGGDTLMRCPEDGCGGSMAPELLAENQESANFVAVSEHCLFWHSGANEGSILTQELP